MWYRVTGLSPLEGIEEIVNDKICQQMFDINKGQYHIEIYCVSAGLPLQVVRPNENQCDLWHFC